MTWWSVRVEKVACVMGGVLVGGDRGGGGGGGGGGGASAAGAGAVASTAGSFRS